MEIARRQPFCLIRRRQQLRSLPNHLGSYQRLRKKVSRYEMLTTRNAVNYLKLGRRLTHQSSTVPATADDIQKIKRRRQLYDSIIRVDHAGELGANRIYAGQMAILGQTESGPLIQHMWDQEKVHLATFVKLIGTERVRPTILTPIWNVAGFVLGAATAAIGKEAAMTCTVAVEETIIKHYDEQIRTLMAEEDWEEHKELLEKIKKFRDEELEHHDTGLENDAKKAPLYSVLYNVIKTGCKGAIWLSTRI